MEVEDKIVVLVCLCTAWTFRSHGVNLTLIRTHPGSESHSGSPLDLDPEINFQGLCLCGNNS